MVATIVPQADLSRERRELAESIGVEHEELANIYVKRGLKPELEKEVSRQVMAKDALGAHARDELGISEITTARPVRAALTSAATFAAGAALPLLVVVMNPLAYLAPESRLPRCSSWPCSAPSARRPVARTSCAASCA